MAIHKHQPHTVWLIGGGIESLVAASCLINEAKVPGAQIRILDARRQSKSRGRVGNKSSRKRVVTVESHCQDLYKLHKSAEELDQPQLPQLPQPHAVEASLQQDDCSAVCDRHRTEAFMSEPVNFITTLGQKQVWRKNRKDILNFILQDEDRFEGMSIQVVFDSSFFNSYFWRLFSSSFGLRPLHSAVEFHRYICKYLDEVIVHSIQIANPLQFTLRTTALQPLRCHLRDQGVRFQNLLVTDIMFHPDSEPKTACSIQGLNKRGPVLLPVGPEDILIITIGFSASGLSTGTTATAPPTVSAKAEMLLDPSWSLWYALAKKSPKFGNPSSFCTHLPDSRLGMFVIHLPRSDFDEIYTHLLETKPILYHEDETITHSSWSLKLVFPQQEESVERPNGTRSILGYCFTPDQLGEHTRKPMHACSGDEILAEVLGCLNLPPEGIILRARTVPYILPLGLSPLLKRDHGDRPEIIPPNTTNIALVGQYVEIPEDTALMTEYSVRSAQLAVNRLMGPKMSLSEVHKSFLAARYGRKAGLDHVASVA